MKAKLKLWLRRRTLMMLRAIVWHADEWLHRRELRLRDELAAASFSPSPGWPAAADPSCGIRRRPEIVSAEKTRQHEIQSGLRTVPRFGSELAARGESSNGGGEGDGATGRIRRDPMRVASSETFAEWEARRSGVAVISKKEATRRRRGIPARAFDLRFAP